MTPARVTHGPLAAAAAGGPPAPEASGMNWPAEETPDQRPDWREKFALGTDLALIGVVVTAASLPVLTLPAALAAGSTAVRHRYQLGKLPAFRPLLRQFRRGLLPGIPFVVVALLLLVDLIAVSRGWVPGGTPVLTGTAVVACWLAGLATLMLVAVGRDPGAPGRSALRWAWEQATSRPWSALAPALAGVLAFFLALSVPATIPLVIGFHLFAAHVISDRLAPAEV
ncbi:hypothetical protein QLQ12_20955 [Actinoplanes sp. NEAU-A12]|uniref:DUF624 domain-containing protein n=1 Tax=Actinoplanes sandaracinus TaxID=3045177 RepID=A0ABT6WN10_9ACTN|nr:hypothetical protein [Actinoplanes sandaracinus]MDI6101086.1 hypothetical protein [Actinoplanes sandaracinus]